MMQDSVYFFPNDIIPYFHQTATSNALQNVFNTRTAKLISLGYQIREITDQIEALDFIGHHHITKAIFGSHCYELALKVSVDVPCIILYSTTVTNQEKLKWLKLGAYHVTNEDEVVAVLSQPQFVPKLALIAHNGMKEALANFFRKI